MSATLTYPHPHPAHRIDLPYRKIAVTVGIASLLWAGVKLHELVKGVPATLIALMPDYARYHWIGFYRTELSGRHAYMQPRAQSLYEWMRI